MTKYKIITKEVTTKVVDDITCDKCGKSIKPDEYSIAGGKMEIRFGYGSAYDMLHIEIDVCDECWKAFEDSMVNKP